VSKREAIIGIVAASVYGAVGLAVGYYYSGVNVAMFRVMGIVVMVLSPVYVYFQISDIWRMYRKDR